MGRGILFLFITAQNKDEQRKYFPFLAGYISYKIILCLFIFLSFSYRPPQWNRFCFSNILTSPNPFFFSSFSLLFFFLFGNFICDLNFWTFIFGTDANRQDFFHFWSTFSWISAVRKIIHLWDLRQNNRNSAAVWKLINFCINYKIKYWRFLGVGFIILSIFISDHDLYFLGF